MKKRITHPFNAYYNIDSEILILGTMPSVKSREHCFYYMHPQNKFWTILENVFDDIVGITIEDKKEFLKRNKIALWDVIKSCDINGSSDASIKNIVVNDINELIKNSNIKKIFTTGKKAYELYNKYCLKDTNIEAICLYSPSPANCRYSLTELISNYEVIKKKV